MLNNKKISEGYLITPNDSKYVIKRNERIAISKLFQLVEKLTKQSKTIYIKKSFEEVRDNNNNISKAIFFEIWYDNKEDTNNPNMNLNYRYNDTFGAMYESKWGEDEEMIKVKTNTTYRNLWDMVKDYTFFSINIKVKKYSSCFECDKEGVSYCKKYFEIWYDHKDIANKAEHLKEEFERHEMKTISEEQAIKLLKKNSAGKFYDTESLYIPQEILLPMEEENDE